MRNYQVLIIEDEKPAARSLSRKLIALGYQKIEMLHSVSQAKSWFLNNPQPDLIFLDIQLSDGLSFDIFEGLNISSSIIFTTAYDEFALKAFKLNSVDYLLKPISEDELEFAINKYEKINSKAKEVDLQMIKELINPDKNSFKSRFSIKVGQNIKIVNIDDIECIFSENKGTYIYTKDKNQYLLDQSLDQIELNINPSQFFRISRGYIVNIKSIKNISIHSNSRLKLHLQHFPSQDIIVSRERVNDFKNWLE